MLFNGNQFLLNTRAETAAFWICFIFRADCSRTGSRTVIDSPHDAQRVPISGVAVGDRRKAHSLHDVTLDVELLAGGNEAGVGNTFQGSQDRKATGPVAIEACTLDQVSTQWVVGTDDRQRTGLFNAQRRLAVCVIIGPA